MARPPPPPGCLRKVCHPWYGEAPFAGQYMRPINQRARKAYLIVAVHPRQAGGYVVDVEPLAPEDIPAGAEVELISRGRS